MDADLTESFGQPAGADGPTWLPAGIIRRSAQCARHHRLHHQGRLGISGNADDPDGLVFTNEPGRRLTGAGQPAPPGDLVIGGSWTPPSGERLQRRWVHLG